MPLAGGTKEYNTFVGGLVTEASPLTFPENASKDEDNFELNRDGSRQRRKGLDYEVGYALTDLALTTGVMENASVTAYRWEGAGGIASNVFAVVQVHEKIYFFDLAQTNPSANILNGGNPLTVDSATYGYIGNAPMSFTPILGKLMVACKNTYPFYISYNKGTGLFTAGLETLYVRDVWGLDDGYHVATRHPAPNQEHLYNLFNQGWTSATWNLAPNGYASNVDVRHLGKDSSDDFSAAWLIKQYFGNTPAPKGHHVISAFDRGAWRRTFIGVANWEVELGKPTAIATFGSRVFYSGITSDVKNGDSRSPNFTGFVFFSKVVTAIKDAFTCHAEADPTSEHVSDLIDSDGGFVVLPEADNILDLQVIGNSLVVIAENGVWEIYGDTGGFKATSFQVSKVTNVGCIGKGTIVNAENNVLYWSQGGIYNLAFESVSGRIASTNISEKTIQTYYNDIGTIAGEWAKGAYDPANRKVTWVYNNDTNFDGSSFNYKANKALVFDTTLQSFYPRTIFSTPVESPFVAGSIISPGFNSSTHPFNVSVNGDTVEVDGETVNTYSPVRTAALSSLKHLVIKPSSAGNYKLTFADFDNTLFLDWESDDSIGVDAAAYMETGQELFGDTQREKQIPYLTMHFRRSERGVRLDADSNLVADMPSSCMTQVRWDFSDHANSGKYATAFEAYRLLRPYQIEDLADNFDYGQEVITTKSKLRGRGKAMRLRLDTQAGHDLHLFGWAVNMSMGQAV